MDKMFTSIGVVLAALGIGFYIARVVNGDLHQAYTMGGLLWMAIGAATAGLGLKVKSKQEKILSALR